MVKPNKSKILEDHIEKDTYRQDSSGLIIRDVQRKSRLATNLKSVFKRSFSSTLQETQYFDDGKRKIDYILASTIQKSEDEMDWLSEFLVNLERRGVQYEFEYGITLPEVVFVKLHAPEFILKQIAHIRRIKLTCDNDRFSKPRRINRYAATPIHRPDLYPEIYERAVASLTYVRPKHMTSAERSFCMYRILDRAKFGDTVGVNELLRKGVVDSAYPIHEGLAAWPATKDLTDRQLLRKYWGSGAMWNKEQPLYLICKYYGPEMGFYFAFCGFYIKMLTIASAAGILCFLYGIAQLAQSDRFTREICESKIIMCPSYTVRNTCRPKFHPLNISCPLSKIANLFDNNGTVAFSLFMSIWASITNELWKRRQMQLQFKWNLLNVEDTVVFRQEYVWKTKHRHVSIATGEFEPYTPLALKVLRFTYSISGLIAFIMVIFGLIIGIILYRVAIQTVMIESHIHIFKRSSEIFAMVTAAIFNVIVIKSFALYYQPIAAYLTEIENPRTLFEFHESCIYKMYTLAFVNNYLPYFYTAFVLGRFYTYPASIRSFYGFRKDLCHPAGCLAGLFIQLSLIMILNSFVDKIIMYFVRLMKKSTDAIVIRKKKKISFILPQWELDYRLKDLQRFYLSGDYCDAVIQFGLVTFFVAAFPLAPLLALVNNTIELRLNARKYLTLYKRPTIRRLPGIGAWNGIMQAATHISTTISAFVIAFTSEFIPREFYRLRHGHLDGQVNSTLSKFATKDFSADFFEKCVTNGLTHCYYRGNRYPAGHKSEYELTREHWQIILIRLLFVVIYEHIIWIINGLLSYMIPDVPYAVKKQLQYESQQSRERELADMEMPSYNGPKTKFL